MRVFVSWQDWRRADLHTHTHTPMAQMATSINPHRKGKGEGMGEERGGMITHSPSHAAAAADWARGTHSLILQVKSLGPSWQTRERGPGAVVDGGTAPRTGQPQVCQHALAVHAALGRKTERHGAHAPWTSQRNTGGRKFPFEDGLTDPELPGPMRRAEAPEVRTGPQA